MSGMTSNAERVADSIGDLSAALVDMSPAADAAAAIVLPIAVERAPRLTGRLAASLRSVVRPTGFSIESPLPYAAVVHARNPWLAKVVTAAESDIVAAVDRQVDERIAAT
jgi:hypothetical protein